MTIMMMMICHLGLWFFSKSIQEHPFSKISFFTKNQEVNMPSIGSKSLDLCKKAGVKFGDLFL